MAVCLLPGTEVAFEKEIEFERGFGLFSSWKREKTIGDKVARFRHLNADKPNMHHDALEFPNGEIVLVIGYVKVNTRRCCSCRPRRIA